jgi:hypothetical protein
MKPLPLVLLTLAALALLTLARLRHGRSAPAGAPAIAAAQAAPSGENAALHGSDSQHGTPAERAAVAGDAERPAPLSTTLYGSTVDAAGAAIQGAELFLLPLASSSTRKRGTSTFSGPDGGFSLARPAQPERLAARAMGFAPYERLVGSERFSDAPLRIVLTPGRRASAYVVDLRGAAVEGVLATPLDEFGLLESDAQVSGPNGEFRWGALPPTEVRVLLSAPGWAPEVTLLSPAPSAPTWTIVRGEGSRVEVSATEAARLSLRWLNDGSRLRLPGELSERETEGAAVTFERLPAGRYRLRAAAIRGSAVVEREFDLERNSRVALAVEFPALSAARGQVERWDDSTPVAGVELEVRGPAARDRERVVSDEHGNFELSPRPVDEALRLAVLSERWTLAMVHVGDELRFSNSAGGAQVTVQLTPAATVRGRVQLPDGRPADEGQVTLHRGAAEPDNSVGSRRVSREGFEFRLPVTAVGHYTLEALVGELSGAAEFEFRGEDVVDILLAAQWNGVVHGVALPCDPPTSARIELQRVDTRFGEPLGAPHAVATPAVDGAFAFTAVRPGRYRLQLESSSHAGPPFDVAPGQTVGPLQLAPTSHGAPELRGIVLDPTGSPAAGAVVTATPVDATGRLEPPLSVRSAVDGSFVVQPRRNVSHRLGASAARGLGALSGMSAPRLATPGERSLVLTLREPSTSTLVGRLELASDTRATVTMVSDAGSTVGTLEAGEFRLTGAPAGALSVTLTAPGHAPLSLALQAPAFGELDLGVLAPQPLATLSVRAFDRRGASVEGANVFVLPNDAQPQAVLREDARRARTNGAGYAEFRAPEDGSACVFVWKRGLAPARVELRVGSPRQLSVELGASGDLRVERLRPLTRGSSTWTLRVLRLPELEVEREHGLNRWLDRIDVFDLAPGRYRAEWTPHEPGADAAPFEREFTLAAPHGHTLTFGSESTSIGADEDER